jgi:hypothetical protein
MRIGENEDVYLSQFKDVKEEAVKIGRLGLPDNFEDAYDEVIEI